MITEARRNLELKAPGGSAALDRLLKRLRAAAARAPDPALDATLKVAEKDRPVLAAAIGLGCQMLGTGDRRHFGALYGRRVGGVTIHSPRSLAEGLLTSDE